MKSLVDTMPLTNLQIANFFTKAVQMVIPSTTVSHFVQEGICVPNNLKDYDKDSLKQVANNQRNVRGRTPHPNPAPENSTIATPPFTFDSKSHKRMLEVCEIVR